MLIFPTYQTLLTKPAAATNLIDPYFEGKLYYYTNSSGGWGAFWEEDDGDKVSLEVNPTGISAFNERTVTMQVNQTSGWLSFTIDLSSVTNVGRLYFYGRKGDDFTADIALDDLKLYAGDGTTVNFDPSLSSVRNNDLWQCSEDSYSFTNYSGAKSSVPADSAFEDLIVSVNSPIWRFANANTGGRSSGTGPDNAANNQDSIHFVYWESSGGNTTHDKGAYLRWNSKYNLTTGATV
jgi:hypothetical protein